MSTSNLSNFKTQKNAILVAICILSLAFLVGYLPLFASQPERLLDLEREKASLEARLSQIGQFNADLALLEINQKRGSLEQLESAKDIKTRIPREKVNSELSTIVKNIHTLNFKIKEVTQVNKKINTTSTNRLSSNPEIRFMQMQNSSNQNNASGLLSDGLNSFEWDEFKVIFSGNCLGLLQLFEFLKSQEYLFAIKSFELIKIKDDYSVEIVLVLCL